MDSLVLVQFNRPSPPYCAGETAGFAPAEAAALIEAKVAMAAAAPKRLGPSAEPSPPADEMVLVRFLRAYPPYCAGETAAFSAATAADLTERSIARLTDAPRTLAPRRDVEEGPLEEGARVKIEFLKSHTPYAKGERAAFAADQAKDLVKKRLAKYVAADEGPAANGPSASPTDEPLAAAVDPGVQVHGLDDRKPDWRGDQDAMGKERDTVAKALPAPPADKMVKRPPKAKKPPKAKAGR